MKIISAAVALTTVILSPVAMTATPLQLSTPTVNLPAGNVTGIRLNVLYGQIRQVKGINFSLLGLSTIDNFTGVKFDLVN